MANEMVERVTMAILRVAWLTGPEAERAARAAIAAMRDLPDDILSFGEAVAVEAGIQRAFQLMIERALKDQP